eukprot:CAMPEP_0205809286 /NCGR_PEP_ID=MMETSP0205-20121125/13459_1 /ASSEMBLY_ACC=CAM_ASM_000278 /TAXON_ID=36767 /ORGANISM="Euplotes focardii, Strain TN1" /LENGTH=55 /DNA_ID=CAMNT_0053086251 /DNA_START=107 /DNA_END=271 /DNA_ORIENTATION=-
MTEEVHSNTRQINVYKIILIEIFKGNCMSSFQEKILNMMSYTGRNEKSFFTESAS